MEIHSINKISKLIVSHISGEISKEDEEILQQWLKESKENKELFEKISSQLYIDGIGERKLNLQKDMNREWDKLRARTIRKAKIRRISYWAASSAAAVIILLVGLWAVYNNDFTKIEQVADISKKIVPGSNKAIIKLADGKEVVLQSDSVIHLLDNDKVVVNKTDTLEVAGSKKSQQLKYNTIYIPKGGEYIAKLEDGSRIFLNSDTKLRIPVSFSGKQRKVIMDRGEAYFDIAKDKKRPFIVDVKGAKVKVLGTEFNIRAYDVDKKIVTTLVEGSVDIRKGNNSKRLKPGIQANITEGSAEIETKKVNTYEFTAWKQGRLYFENKNLEEIMNDLSRWYDFEVFYMNSEVKDIRFTIDITKYDDIESILRLFEKMHKVRFKIKNRNVIISKIN